MPVAMLAEHLVAQVGHLGAAREAADDRARLLGDLSAITADIFPLDRRRRAGPARRRRRAARRHRTSASRHRGRRDRADAGDAHGEDDEGERPSSSSRELSRCPGPTPTPSPARVSGPEDEVARRVEALDLLVAQARVGSGQRRPGPPARAAQADLPGPGHPRPAHRPAQPPWSGPHRRADPGPPRGALLRPRRLQEHQRHAGPRGR